MRLFPSWCWAVPCCGSVGRPGASALTSSSWSIIHSGVSKPEEDLTLFTPCSCKQAWLRPLSASFCRVWEIFSFFIQPTCSAPRSPLAVTLHSGLRGNPCSRWVEQAVQYWLMAEFLGRVRLGLRDLAEAGGLDWVQVWVGGFESGGWWFGV